MAASTVTVQQKGDVKADHNAQGQYEYDSYSFAPWGKGKLAVTLYEIKPGKSAHPFHSHTDVEEVFYVIGGKGVVETLDGSLPVSAGSVVICPVGDGGAHRFVNTSDSETLSYLDIDTVPKAEVMKYPRTGKVGVITSDGFFKLFKGDAEAGYYDGE